MSAPSGVSNSSLSMRANTDYDMDDFTGRHDHRVGGSLCGDTINMAKTMKLNNLTFTQICFLAFLPLYFLIGTSHNPGKGWFFLLLTTVGFLFLLYESWKYFSQPHVKDGKSIYILTIIGSMMFLVSALQVQNEAPVGGLGFFLFLQFCIFVYYLVFVCEDTKYKYRNLLITVAVITSIACLMPKNAGTIAFVVLLCLCVLVWFLMLAGLIPDNLMPDILSKMPATVAS